MRTGHLQHEPSARLDSEHRDATPGQPTAPSTSKAPHELTSKLLEYIEEVEQGDMALLARVKELERSVHDFVRCSRSLVTRPDHARLGAALSSRDDEPREPTLEATREATGEADCCADSIGWLVVLPITQVDDMKSNADIEEQRFLEWLSASDKMVEEHKDPSGWEEPTGVMQRVRDRLSPLALRGAGAQHAQVH